MVVGDWRCGGLDLAHKVATAHPLERRVGCEAQCRRGALFCGKQSAVDQAAERPQQRRRQARNRSELVESALVISITGGSGLD